MAGQQCPNCKELTLFKDGIDRKCNKCGMKVKLVRGSGRGGPGKKCVICKQMTVHKTSTGEESCGTCGAQYMYPT